MLSVTPNNPCVSLKNLSSLHNSCIVTFSLLQAFDKIKTGFPVPGGHLELIQEDRYVDVMDIMANQFMPDETICGAFGVVWNQFSEQKISSVLKQNLSIMAVSDDTNEMMGIRTCRIAKKSDVNDLSHVTYENVKDMWTFLCHKDEEMDLFNRFNLEEMFHFVTLAVHKNYRRRGLGFILLSAGVALAKELGFKAVKGEGTSTFSQRIYEKRGFETILEIPYNQYAYKGGYLGERTGQHTSTKIYMLLL